MRALVTGGAGFIGSHLCDLLLHEGHEVVALDNLVTGRESNLAEAKKSSRFRFVKGDARDPAAVQDVMAGIGWVFHLAAIADIVPSVERPVEYVSNNVDCTTVVLEAARHAKVKRLVYAASSSAYGIPDQYPTPEKAPARPQYPYALSKYLGEIIVAHWCQVYGLPTLSLRLFNVYGRRVRTTGAYGAVFGVFLAQKLNDKPLTIVGDGTQVRDFVHVSDTVRAFLNAAESPETGKILNIGTGRPQSVLHLADLVGGERVHIPKRPGEPDRTEADIRLARRYLKWEPQMPFKSGVRDMMEHLDDWRDAPVWTPDSIAEATKTWFAFLGKGDAGKGTP